uniref:Uncharacterized protein n=1 Tax=Arundo donax TaxID=35708 RepID=A0A0A9EC36_ARUDO
MCLVEDDGDDARIAGRDRSKVDTMVMVRRHPRAAAIGSPPI